MATTPAIAFPPECDDLLALYPPGQYTVEPAGGGPPLVYQVWYEFPGTAGEATQESFHGPLISVHQYAEGNPTCDNVISTASYTFSRTEGWSIGYGIGVQGGLEWAAGIVFAKAKAAAGGSLAFNQEWQFQDTTTTTVTSQTVLPPCTAKEYEAFKRKITGYSSMQLVEVRVKQECIYWMRRSSAAVRDCGRVRWDGDLRYIRK